MLNDRRCAASEGPRGRNPHCLCTGDVDAECLRKNPVKHAVMNTKTAAQGCDTDGGLGTHRPQK